MTDPLVDPNVPKKAKTWILPLEVTVMVDDPTKYDGVMEQFIKDLLNELRGVVNLADGGRKQLTIIPREIIKDTVRFNELVSGVKAGEALKGINVQELIQAEIKKALGK